MLKMQYKNKEWSAPFRRWITCLLFLTGLWTTGAWAQTFTIVGTGTAANSSSGYPAPFGNYYWGARHQFFVTGTQLSTAGVSGNSNISSLGFNITALNGANAHQGFSVKVYNVGSTTNPLATGYVSSTLVAQSTATTVNPAVVGWYQISFNSPFLWNGTDNLVIETCFNNSGYNTNISTQWTTTGLGTGTWSRWYRADASGVCGSTTTTSTSTTTRPNMRFEWIASGGCTGTPAPGNTVSSAASVCIGASFNLSLQNSTSGSGVTYQWKSSPDNVTYIDIVGANSSTLTTSQPTPTYYKCEVTCGSNTGTSTPLQVTMNVNAVCLAYCVGTGTCTSGDHVTGVNFNSGAINNTSGPCLGSGGNSAYSDYRGTVPYATVQAAQSYPLTVTVNNGGTEFAAAWIDLDQSGTFDASEFINVPMTLGGSWSGTVSVSIPANATSGFTVLRVRSKYSTALAAGDACANVSYSETEDYLINITPAPGCGGVPTPGATTAASNPVCASSNFILGLSTPPAESGITYDWQSSPDGVTYTSTGGTAPTYTGNQTTDTYYQCVVTCTNSGLSATSTPLLVTMNSFLNCYCTPSHQFGTSGGFYGPISNVTLNTLNNTSSYPAALPYYTDYPASGSTTTSLVAGATYTMSISSQYYLLGAWFDWNQNGIFEAGEYTSFGSNSSGSVVTSTQAITVPVTASTGATKMRVNSEAYFYTMSGASACGPFNYGETEDYTITVLVAGNCSGTPSASVTTASVTNLCPGGSVNLGTSPLYSDAGITYDWQSSPDGINFTSTGVTTPLYTATGFTATTWYQCVVTCTNSGGGSVTSTPVQVSLNPFYNCYCAITNAGGSCITNVSFNTMSHTTPGCENAPSYYTQVPPGTATTTVYQGVAYTFSLTTDGGAIESVWIDYDHSGTFDAGEWQQVTTSSSVGVASTISITIPLTALTGNTGMRVRTRATGNQNGAGDACLAMGSGESQDYTIDIQTPAGCAGTPAPGSTASTSGSLACSGQPFTLSMPGLAYTSGLAYQWYSSPDGVTYTPISGATAITLTTSQTAATYYYCTVTCTNSGLSGNSSALNLGMNSFVNCYCTPNSSFGTSGGFYGVISNVTFNTLNNTSTYPASTPYYTDYAPAGSTTTTVVAGATYNLSISSGFYNWAGAWFDWNQNGLFESSEFTSFGNNSTGSNWTGTQAITIPTGAIAGTTKMRVRTEYYGNAFSGTDACTLFDNGESEDYTITVDPAVGCTGTPAAATTTSTANPVCSGINFTLAPNTLYSEAGLTYDWQSSPDGVTYTSTGVTTQLYTLSQMVGTYYQLVVTCTNSGLSTTTTPLQVTMNSVANCYCVAGATTDGFGTNNEYVGNVTLNTINNTSTSPAGPANQYTDFTSISTQLVMGSTYTGEVLVSNYFGGDQAAIWIDFNQDGTFNTTTEQFILTGGASGVPFTGSITIPGSATPGSTRMRVRGNYTGAMSPCGITTFGEVEDYTVNISTPSCVLAPTYPANGSNGCPNGTNITLSWPALAGATGYDVYVGTTTPPTSLVSSNQPGTTFSADISAFAPTYYWMVVPQIVGGGMSCAVWSFGLNPAPVASATGNDPCAGTTLSLTGDNTAAGQTAGNTYQWSGPASFSSTQQNPNRNNALASYGGVYTLTVTNSFLCSATTTVTVAVNPNPTLSQVSFVNVGCIGGSDGEMTVEGNTAGPYDYSIDNFATINNSGYFTGLPTGPTTYYVQDANGCSGTGSFSLTYTSTTPPSASVIVPFIGMPTYVCSGTSTVLSIPAVANTTKYIWDAPTGAYFNGNPLNVSPFTTTAPTVQVTYGNPTGSLYVTGVQAANGCGQSTRKIQKTRGTLSVPVSISGAATVCASSTGTYTTPPVDAATSYEWTITGNATVSGTGTTATVTFGAGWNGGTLCVAAQTSCFTSPTKCITLGTSASQVNALSGTFTACPNQTIAYSVAPSAGAASYNWTLPSGATGSSTSNTISAAFGAGYSAVGSICVSVTSICGVTSPQKCKTVAPGLPVQPASVTGYLSGVCNQTVVYSAPAISGTTFTWSVPSGATVQSGQGTPNISAHFGTLSTGGVCVTASNSCGSSIARCVTVKGAPNSPPSITATPSSWCAGTPGIEFAANTSGLSGSYTLNWTYPPASVATYVLGGGNSSSLILDWISGTGSVNVTSSNACGAATRPSTWSSTCRESEVGTVATITVSPNPTTGVLNVNYTATKGHTAIQVLDLTGRVVFTQNTNSIDGVNNTQLDMSKLAKGAYMLNVQSTQGNKLVRVVVE